MFYVLGQFVARRWPWVIAGWLLIVVGLRFVAPSWDDIAYDGDLAYLPHQSPSVRGEFLLERAFPNRHAKSQFVVVLAREDGPLTSSDLHIGLDVARRLKNLHGATLLHNARRQMDQDQWEIRVPHGRAPSADAGGGPEAPPEQRSPKAEELLVAARAALDEAVEFDLNLTNTKNSQQSFESLPEIYWNRRLVAQLTGDLATAESDRQRALLYAPELSDQECAVLPALASELPILDVWTWRDEVFGRKLISEDKQARLIVVRIANEFLALRNQPLLRRLEAELEEVRTQHRGVSSSIARIELVGPMSQHDDAPEPSSDVKHDFHEAAGSPQNGTGRPQADRTPEVILTVSGSAAVGGDMLLSAKESIEDTELFTVILIVAILTMVYRAPLLVFIPLVSIVVAFLVSTSLVALFATWSETQGPEGWWQFKIFTTTKIFIVVILYGAGTDYCLFLISRYREELELSGSPKLATAKALAGVGDALLASALTTIFGLSMMFFSDFGKLRFSGPVIGFCLAVGLLVCLTLTPALLQGCGRWVFWPRRGTSGHDAAGRGSAAGLATGGAEAASSVQLLPPSAGQGPAGITSRLWERLADTVVRRPGAILIVTLLILLPLVPRGLASSQRVTYDVLSALDASRPSRVGTTAMRRHFPVGESGPLTIVLHQPQADFHSTEGRQALSALTAELYQVDGVRQIRSLVDPLGDFPPGTRRIGLTNRQAWRTWMARSHHQTNALFLAQTPEFPGDLTRLDVVLAHDPFSRESLEVLHRLDEALQAYCGRDNEYFRGAQIAYSGPTAAVRDLRGVTQQDQRRIEWLVILAVYVVLVVILRRPGTCLFLILSVLLTYFVTLGITEAFFAWVHGPSFTGLDWKVPLFLFVILVAVGQDYNVYLVTRVIEEQQVRGPIAGLREAMVRTGGIITSCGVIMAGTFFSMTSVVWGGLVPDWLPQLQGLLTSGGGLRGMVELGFALALGVLLDTFLVRPVLVPAFLALVSRWQATRKAASSGVA